MQNMMDMEVSEKRTNLWLWLLAMGLYEEGANTSEVRVKYKRNTSEV